jgi:hypothetical protein
MVRSHWTKTVVLGLACAGVARSQAPAPPPAAATPERVITLQESGKPRQQCQILQTWQMPDGGTAYQVQSLQSGEMMTVVASAKPAAGPAGPGDVRAVSTRIYHWGHSTTPPPGTPVPPNSGTNQSAVVPAAASSDPTRLAPTAAPSSAGTTPLAQGAVGTVPSSAANSRCGTCDSPAGMPVPSRHSLFGRHNSDACGTCCDSCNTSAQVVQDATPPRPTLLSRLLHRSETVVEQPGACCESIPAPAGSRMAPSAVASAQTSTAQPGDFRESWGKVEPWKPALAAGETVPGPKPGPEAAGPAGARDADVLSQLPGGLPVVQPAGPPPMPPDPFGNQRAMRPQYPVFAAPQMAADQGIPDSMANAFTPGGTPRPIPANFGQVEYPANAFSAPASDAMASAMAQSAYTPQGGGQPNGTMPQFNAFYYPGMAPAAGQAAAAGYRPAMLPAGYTPAGAGQPVMQSPVQRPTMLPQSRGPVVPPGAGLEPAAVPQLVNLLKTSLYPSQREWAADCLAHQDCASQPHVVQALVVGAKDDPAPGVRAGCVRALAQLRVNTRQVVATLQALQADGDPRVRHEAEQALPALGVAVRPHAESGLRPVSASTGDR